MLACLEDNDGLCNKLAEQAQSRWLPVVITENIVEKYYLLYRDNQAYETISPSLANINERLLFLFNNLLTQQYFEQIYIEMD